MTVEEIGEGEDNFGGYDEKGKQIVRNYDYTTVVFSGVVHSYERGKRRDLSYPIIVQEKYKILLINRKGE
jgi:hypothetical protein